MRTVLQMCFVFSCAFAFYTLIGYPLVLLVLGRFRPRPIRKQQNRRTVTVLLPVRNGERWLRSKLESLLALHYPPELLKILVISDGSSDDTDSIVLSFAPTGRVDLLRVPPGGKALALNAGLEHATGDILFFTDVRQPLEPDSLAHLVACLADESVGVVSGELIILEGETHEEASVGLYWKYEKWMRKGESRIDSIMGATGCIYAMRRELAVKLPPGTLVDDMYLPFAAFFRGYRMVLDDAAKAFDYPTQLDAEFRRKVRTLAGVYQIIRLYPQLLTRRNRMWHSFFWHKLARLLLPYALLVLAGSSFALPSPLRTIAIAAQGAVYGLAVLDYWIPDRFPLKRVTAPLRSFLVLLSAAFCAASVLFVRSQDLWKETRAEAVRS